MEREPANINPAERLARDLEDLFDRALAEQVAKLLTDNTEKTIDILESIVKHLYTLSLKQKNILGKEIKEIENTISLGIPGWVKYTRTTKSKK